MKKYCLICLLILVQIVSAKNNMDETRKHVLSQNALSNNHFFHPYLKNEQADSCWQLIDWQVIMYLTEYLEPVDFYFPSPYQYFLNIQNISEWGHWNGWRSHTIRHDNNTMFTYHFDSKGNLQEAIQDNIEAFPRDTRYIYKYDGNINIMEKMKQRRDNNNSNWVSTVKITATYNINRKINENIQYNWNKIDSIWEMAYKTTYSYLQNNKISEVVSLQFDNNNRYPLFFFKYIYNQDELISEILWKSYEYDTTKFIYSYSSNNKVDTCTELYLEKNIWLLISRKLNKYDTSGNISEQYEQKWDTVSNSWKDISKEVYNYNSGSNIIELIRRNWDESLNNWENRKRLSYSYNSDGNPDTSIYYDWDSVNQQWGLADNICITYTDSNAIINNNALHNKNYPISIIQQNGIVKFILNSTAGENDRLNVYDLQGRLVYSTVPQKFKNKSIYTWDLTKRNMTFSNKVYIITIQYQGQLLTNKIIPFR